MRPLFSALLFAAVAWPAQAEEPKQMTVAELLAQLGDACRIEQPTDIKAGEIEVTCDVEALEAKQAELQPAAKTTI